MNACVGTLCMPAVRRYQPSHQYYFFRTFRDEQLLASAPLRPKHYAGRCHYYHASTTLLLSSTKDQHPANDDGGDTLPVEARSFPLDRAKSSGRSKKRTQRRLHWKRERLATNRQETTTVGSELYERDDVDRRTWRTILFPPAYDDGSNPDPPIPWPKSPKAWYHAFGDAWILYKGTWEGFLSNASSKPKKEDAVTITEEQKDGKNSTATTQKIMDNASRNIEMTQEEGGKLLEEVKSKTGIYTVEDVKRVAKEMMKVATAMLGEFMMQYRKGRDEEVEKMLHEYFQEEEKKDNNGVEENNENATTKSKEEEGAKRTKRRPKRRKPSSLTI